MTVASAGGAGGAVLRGPRRACLQLILTPVTVRPLPFPRGAPYSTQRAPRIACDRHQYPQWRPGEGAGQRRWWMGAWSRGGSVRVRVHANTPIFSVPHVQHRSHSTKHVLLAHKGGSRLWRSGAGGAQVYLPGATLEARQMPHPTYRISTLCLSPGRRSLACSAPQPPANFARCSRLAAAGAWASPQTGVPAQACCRPSAAGCA